MERTHVKDNDIWKKQFGNMLKRFFNIYEINYRLFAEVYRCNESTVRYWFSGRNLPHYDYLLYLKSFFAQNVNDDEIHKRQVYEEVSIIFDQQNMKNIYCALRRRYPDIEVFIGEVLATCYQFAKNDLTLTNLYGREPVPSGKTQAVVFDFDGTLTSSNTIRTTWEKLWMRLGYNARLCQELHIRYDRGEISHPEWCKLTEEKFRDRNLNKKAVEKLATQIHLLKGTRETFRKLNEQDIKIYIVSGSILIVIRSVLGNLCQYVEEIKANQFQFDKNGYLTRIIGTNYDFEGKADFINEIADELKISPKDILFVGNSINDRFAHNSGARTLCINPRLTDTTDREVWNDCIPTCEDLQDILKYIL